jgi:hypothetical protein
VDSRENRLQEPLGIEFRAVESVVGDKLQLRSLP